MEPDDQSEPTPADSTVTEPVDSGLAYQTRRRVLQAAAAGALTAVGLSASAQEDEGDLIELGGEVDGWVGRVPADIEGETNPTLELEAGTTYALEWENADGLPHNVVVEDEDGESLVVSEIVGESGEVQTVEFEAAQAMAEYYCEVHPQSMRGEIEIVEGGDDQAIGADEEPEEEEPEEERDGDRFFRAGTEVGVRTIADGMTAPTDAAMDADDGRLFVTDQTGELWIVTEEWATDSPFVEGVEGDPALDLSDRMVAVGEEFAGQYADPDQDYDERGLLGVALHPEFAENGRLYLHYSAPPEEFTPEGWSHVEVIAEFRLTQGGGSVDPDSERRLMGIQSPQYNHDGGPIAFGPDGYLYVPMGDGGGANDSMEGHVDDWYDENEGGNGQDTTQTGLGGIHRIDVDSRETIRGSRREYGVPEDNPLVDAEGHLEEYYAWGFRNPFGITFDSDGTMVVADAGQNRYEEASVVERGGNYGWNVKEGTHCFSTESPGSPPSDCPEETPDDVRDGEELVDPVVEYPHEYEGSSVGIVIAGGHVYEAGAIDDLQNRYVFGDWTRDVAREEPDGRLFAAAPRDDAEADDDDSDVPRDELWEMEELQIAGTEDGSLGRFVRQFGQGPDGEVLVLASARGVPEGDTGEVLELVPPEEGEELSEPELPQDENGENATGGDGENATGGNGENATGGDGENATGGNGENATGGNGENATGNDSA